MKRRTRQAKKAGPAVRRRIAPTAVALAPAQVQSGKAAVDPEAIRRAEKKFWTGFWIIKSVLLLIIFILLFIFVARFLRVLKGI